MSLFGGKSHRNNKEVCMNKHYYCFSALMSLMVTVLQAQEPTITTAHEPLEDLGSITLSTLPILERFKGFHAVQAIQSIPQNLPVDTQEIIASYKENSNTAQPTDDVTIMRQPVVSSPPASLTFEALDDTLTVIPPDTMGAVGPNHIMTTLNDRIRIHNKIGGILLTLPIASFWQTTSALFDPKITYDPFSNRWTFVTLSNPASSSSRILIAVSQTNDPTAGWFRFALAADGSGASWADFPSLGFNSKWIIVQTNMFSVSSGGFTGSHIYVFNKANLYAGITGAIRFFNLTGFGATQAPAMTYDNANPNLYLLQNWNGNAGGAGYLRLYTISGAIGSEILTSPGFIAIGNPWASSHPIIDGGFAPQLSSTRRIMNNDSRMLSITFRNGSIWAAQTVFLPATSPTHSAVQWLQINPTGAIQQFGRIEDPAANLNSGTFFAFPSIAVNTANDVLVGYSFFNPLTYASSGYSFRSHTDPINTLRGTAILRTGLDTYVKDFGSGTVRWGDYSNTVVDPNGTDFWTIQESADLHSIDFQSRWVTWWGTISPLLAIPPLAPLADI